MLWMSCLPAASLVLLLLPCFPGQKGGENEQQTHVISVWEGDSISLICSRKILEEVLGTYLTASKKELTVLFVASRGTSYIPPELAHRLNYSDDGKNLRITLHNAQQSDSNIYQCSTYVMRNGYHSKLYGKKTIVVVKAQTSGVLDQSPLYVNPQPGQSISITCAWNSSYEDEEFYFLKTLMQRERVLHVSSQNVPTISLAFANRLEYSREKKKIVVTLHNLQEDDSGVYVCAGVLKNVSFLSVSENGTMMLIKDVEQTDCSKSSWAICALTIIIALLFTALMCCILYCVNVRKCFQKRKSPTASNTVYEDMSYSSRRNTLNRTNVYFLGN